MADDKDTHLSGLYRLSSREEPPDAVDRAVMELARKSVRRRTLAPFGNHWVAAGALAGICIVSVLLVVLLPEQAGVPDLPQSMQDAGTPARETQEEVIHLQSAADEAAGSGQDDAVARERFDFYSVMPEAKREAPIVAPVMAPAVPPPSPAQSGRAVSHVLQIDGFSSLEEARAMQDKLAFMRLESRILQDARAGTGYLIRVGPYTDLRELGRVQALLDKRGIKSTREREP